MKIEMGESLIRTWMRHCLGCQLAELNWKPSPLWPAHVSHELEQWYQDGKSFFPEQVFKKTADLKQFLSQAEIDVFGISIGQGKAEKIIAADVAFHTNGLQYGTKSETKAKIIKKMFRAALTIKHCFPENSAEILFLSPKVTPATELCVNDAAQMVQIFFANRCNKFKFNIICNDTFKIKVFDEVALLQNKVADTSELYLRAVQMAALFDKRSPFLPQTSSSKTIDRSVPTQTLPIELEPNDSNAFRDLLLEHRSATIYEYYQDGHCEKKDWTANKLNKNSSISGNLRSKKKYRQGKWQELKLTKLVVKIKALDN